MESNLGGRPLRVALPLLLAATCSTGAEEFPLDQRVKASYLLNLLRFVEWPYVGGYPSRRFNLKICGAERLDAYRALHGRRVHDRTIVVERLKDLRSSHVADCHLLIIGGERPIASVPIARGLLTVGETEGFTARGGLVNLLLVGGRVRFELNEDLAQACGFAIDPQLAKLKIPSRNATAAR